MLFTNGKMWYNVILCRNIAYERGDGMYIARQAIFDRTLNVYGYELLFRGGEHSYQFDAVTSISASASVIGGMFETGINQIVDDKIAFINFNKELLYTDVVELIEADRLVIEVLEDVVADDSLISRIKELREKGYKIALDDYMESCSTTSLLPYADIIKYDLIQTPLDRIKVEVQRALSLKKIILAEKVETEEEFIKAKSMGFHLFQGFFFSKPHLVAESNSHTTVKAQYMRVINELKKEEPSYQALAEIVEKDASLSYRLVKLSSIRAGKDPIYSIRNALQYMGLREIERWVSVLMLRELNDSKPDELMRISLIRTKFCELVASRSNLKQMKYEASIMGLFSTIDAMIDKPMYEALQNIALADSITNALIWKKGILSPIYQLVMAYEAGDWTEAEKASKDIKVNENDLLKDYISAVKWAKETIDKINL